MIGESRCLNKTNGFLIKSFNKDLFPVIIRSIFIKSIFDCEEASVTTKSAFENPINLISLCADRPLAR
jgi:hypothetical protein